MSEQKIIPELTPDIYGLLIGRLRHFIANIKSETPEQQHNLLKQYLVSVTANKTSGGFKLVYRLDTPNLESFEKIVVLEKSLYFGVDAQY